MIIKIEAIVRPEKAQEVVKAMSDAGVKGYSYWNITGRGQQEGVDVFTGRGGHLSHIDTLPKTMIMTVIDGKVQETVINAIVEAAKTDGGTIGDGKIFVSELQDAIRVRTNERGEETIS